MSVDRTALARLRAASTPLHRTCNRRRREPPTTISENDFLRVCLEHHKAIEQGKSAARFCRIEDAEGSPTAAGNAKPKKTKPSRWADKPAIKTGFQSTSQMFTAMQLFGGFPMCVLLCTRRWYVLGSGDVLASKTLTFATSQNSISVGW